MKLNCYSDKPDQVELCNYCRELAIISNIERTCILTLLLDLYLYSDFFSLGFFVFQMSSLPSHC